MSLKRRLQNWESMSQTIFDVAIIGGGINGACLYNHLSRDGYRVLLLDKGDFAGATSQASAMMIWGGLLYLRNWDMATVWQLCASRERLIRKLRDCVQVRLFRYVPALDGPRGTAFSHAALHFYWLLGGCQRVRPRREKQFSEKCLLNTGRFTDALLYEEAQVLPSDARFVLHWICSGLDGPSMALNYCALSGGNYERHRGLWRLELTDTLRQHPGIALARWVVNASGVWSDALNQQFNIQSPYKHIFSQGVFIGLKRDDRHDLPLIFDAGDDGDCRSLIPWGPVALWGPTETVIKQPEHGFTVRPENVSMLLEELNQRLAMPATPEDIVSLRCGVRAVAVAESSPHAQTTQHLSRRYRIHRHVTLPWISLYGSNLSNCIFLAEAVRKIMRRHLVPSSKAETSVAEVPMPEYERFPGLAEPVPSARWCAEHEMCWTLDDYLRRRTNISQWVPRCGLGPNDDNVDQILRLARIFHDEELTVAQAVKAYRQKVNREFDSILNHQVFGGKDSR